MKYQLKLGDCLDVLRTLPDNSVDAIVTDPPYGLSFMGRKWDYDVPSIEVWAECLRVLKPGGHMLAFAGTRTQHRMAVRIEDAGFEIRDMIAWLYGSGFPKSLDVSKAIDKAADAEREVLFEGKAVKRMIPGADQSATGSWIKNNGREFVPTVTAPATDAAAQWQGWGTALKPALEPITVARKPLVGTVAANVLEHGTGALNIDGCRVAAEYGGRPLREVAALRDGVQYTGNALAGRVDGSLASSKAVGSTDLGRWPANLIHDGSDEVLVAFPEAKGQQGDLKGHNKDRQSPNGVFGKFAPAKDHAARIESDTSAARFFYCAKASRADRNEGTASGSTPAVGANATMREREQADWPARNGNHHPTVKPTDLMAYLCRLVTPPGGTVLDPFMGSGSTGKAAIREGFRFIGIEREAEYLAIAKVRIEHETRERPTEPAQRGLFSV